MIATTIISSISVKPLLGAEIGILPIVLSSSLRVCDIYPLKWSDNLSLQIKDPTIRCILDKTKIHTTLRSTNRGEKVVYV